MVLMHAKYYSMLNVTNVFKILQLYGNGIAKLAKPC